MQQDRYAWERELARGGTGPVWLGRDRSLERPVALKRIGVLPGGTEPDLERAEREARLAARLSHPHVVAVYDLVEESDGHWLVMEYVPGTTLARRVAEQGPLDAPETTRVFRAVADALAAAHRAGIVHRDVKPSNVLLDPDAGTVKLSDFGIARAEGDASLTRTGLVTGSPAYLAPEVASGGSATFASDVWALGATLYQALTGQAPYEMEGNLVGGLYRIVHDPPPRLPDHGPLGRLLEVTMVHDPARRWSAAAVRSHLASGAPGDLPSPTVTPAPAADDGESAHDTAVVPPGGAQPPPRDPSDDGRRRRPALLAAAAALTALVVLAGWWFLGGPGADEASDPPPEAGPSPEEPTATTDDTPTRTPTTDAPTLSPPDPAAMRAFAVDYLETVTQAPRAAFDRLTPAFQEQSGGFAGYQGFWGTIASATPSNVRADPQEMTVSYDVAYVRQDGSRSSDQVQLRLVRRDGRYLIDGES